MRDYGIEEYPAILQASANYGDNFDIANKCPGYNGRNYLVSLKAVDLRTDDVMHLIDYLYSIVPKESRDG